jgi:hypothetical protein
MPEDITLHNYRCENLKSYKWMGCFSVGFLSGPVWLLIYKLWKIKLRGFYLQANYTDKDTAACRRS